MAAQVSRSHFPTPPTGMAGTRRRMAEGREAARSLVQSYPIAATMAALGVGMGLGVWVGLLLIPPPRPQYGLAEKVGRQVLQSLSAVLPESLAARLPS